MRRQTKIALRESVPRVPRAGGLDQVAQAHGRYTG
ncbi:MAG: hypothetical protein PWR11_449, partial [Bacillota bacterium]|nr:hypothetical protein [Bacillota bacterium]